MFLHISSHTLSTKSTSFKPDFKGTQRDRTLKHGFNQVFAGRKVFVSYENVFLFQ